MGINTEFNKFISNNIALSQDDISKKVGSRQWVIDKVIAKIKEKTGCPQLYKEGNIEYIHFGSYFKGTKVSIVDEFDIMLILDSNGGMFSIGGTKVGDGVGITSPNPLFNGNYHKEDNSGVSPRKIMNWLKKTIDEALEAYGCEASEKDGQAVTVYLKSKDYYIDFVPGCIIKKLNSDDIFYVIPKGDTNGNWIQTNPRIDKEIIADVSSNYTQFKNTIKLFKYLFTNSYNVAIGSYAVESCVIDYESKHTFYDDFEYDFIGVLNHIIGLVEGDKIPDMRDSNINLLGNINKETTLKELNNIKSGFEALEEDADDFSESVEALLKNE
jgi:hypothetical protein